IRTECQRHHERTDAEPASGFSELLAVGEAGARQARIGRHTAAADVDVGALGSDAGRHAALADVDLHARNDVDDAVEAPGHQTPGSVRRGVSTTVALPSLNATTEWVTFGGTTPTKPGPAIFVSPPIVISSAPSSTCQTSSCSWLWAWMSAPLSNS